MAFRWVVLSNYKRTLMHERQHAGGGFSRISLGRCLIDLKTYRWINTGFLYAFVRTSSYGLRRFGLVLQANDDSPEQKIDNS